MKRDGSLTRQERNDIRTEINRLAFSLQTSIFLQIRDDLDTLSRELLANGASPEEVASAFMGGGGLSISYSLSRVINNKPEPEQGPNNAREATEQGGKKDSRLALPTMSS